MQDNCCRICTMFDIIKAKGECKDKVMVIMINTLFHVPSLTGFKPVRNSFHKVSFV